MKKEIIWEPQYYEFDPIHRKLLKMLDEDEVNILQDDEYDEDEGEELSDIDIQKLMMQAGPMEGRTITATPFGLYDIDDSLHPFRQYQLWMGHTNFSIGEKTAITIEFTPGVEVLAILTRYRFLIGIGKCFKINDVRADINKRLIGDNKTFSDVVLTNGEQLSTVVKQLKTTNKDWALYVFPNKNYEIILHGDNNFEKTKELLRLSSGESNGIYLDNNSSEIQGL